MFLTAPDGRQVALCYSMNVHPGEGLDDVLAAIETYVVPLKARLGVDGPFAVGLRLANRAAVEFGERAQELIDAFQRHDLRAVTVNAFPYGNFHSDSVKEEVYKPDWADAHRAIYTLRCAVALAALNPEGAGVSLSTVPLSFKAFQPSHNAVTHRLLEMVSALQGVERKSNVKVSIGVEPEPFCLLETAAETVDWWQNHLMPGARATFGRGAEDLARRYLSVCVDTCHHAVRWEDGAEVLRMYADAEIPVSKIQLSSALEAPSTAELEPWAEPRYLHQVVAQSGEDRADLGGEPITSGPVRCHFHVPVHKAEVGGLKTTRDEMVATLKAAWEAGTTDCLEIETYTWDVLPIKEGELLDSLEAEYRFVLGNVTSTSP
jgi:hypothetical protein